MVKRQGLFTLFVIAGLALMVALPAMAATVLPSGFAGKGVGNGGGSITDDGTTLTIQAKGADYEDADTDSFYFVSMPVTGDGTITARLTGAKGGADDGGERVGLMIRETTDPDSAFAAMNETNDNHGLSLNWRDAKGNTGTHEAGYGRRLFPVWFRGQRAGTNFTGFYSWTGDLWIPTNTKAVTMGAAANMGLAVASHDDSVTMTTTWDNVSVSPGAPLVTGLQACGNDKGVMLTWSALGGAKGYNIFRGAPNIALRSATKAQLVQINKTPVTDASFTDMDASIQTGARQVYAVAAIEADGTQGPLTLVVGGQGTKPPSPLPDYTLTVFGNHPEGTCAQGSMGAFADPTSGVITLRAGGFDFWSDHDDSVLLSQKVTGDFTATVQILDFPNGVNPCCGKAGLFLREALTPTSRYAGCALRTDGLRQQRRMDSSSPDDSEGSFVLPRDDARMALQTAGIWLQVKRTGNNVATNYSMDGKNFQPIDDPVTLDSLAADVQIGLQQGARDRDDPIQMRLSESEFKGLTITKP
jgi:hypothetical protein